MNLVFYATCTNFGLIKFMYYQEISLHGLYIHVVSMNKKIIVILIVVILVVGAAGAVLLGMNQDSKGKKTDNTNGRLMVYGNANNDDYLDNDDLKMIESVIKGDAKESDYPYSDANHDGEVNDDDIEFVKRMIKREAMTIHAVNGFGDTVDIKYPIKGCVVVGSNAMLAVHAIGGVTNGIVKGVTGESGKDKVLFSDVLDLPAISKKVTEADYEAVSNIAGVTAVITQASTAYLKNEATFVAGGYDVFRISSSDGDESTAVAITLGYLMGLEERAMEYAIFCDNILKKVTDYTKTLADSAKKTAMTITMTNYLGGHSSDYYEISLRAGANNVADWEETTRQFNLDQDWLYDEKYDTDFLFHFRNISYDMSQDDINQLWATYSIYFQNTECYKNGGYLVINGYMPAILRMAYMAELMYPDHYNGYAAEQHQYYIDHFVDNLSEKNFKIADHVFVIDKNMVTA